MRKRIDAVQVIRTLAPWWLLALVLASCGLSGGATGPEDSNKGGLEIRDVSVTPTDTTATIEWTTTQQTVGTLSFGRSQDNMNGSRSSSLSSRHQIQLQDLEPDTEYWFRITAANPSGPRQATQPVAFRTLPAADLADTTAPVLSDIQVVGITSSTATILWRTDDRSVATVHYGTTTGYGLTAAEHEDYPRLHSISLAGLDEERTYNFRIDASNRAGLQTRSDNFTFVTLGRPWLEISPDTIRASEGEVFEFRLSLRNVANLAGISFMLAYDPAVMEILTIEEGDFWFENGGFIPLMLEYENDDIGRLQYAMSWEITFEGDNPVGTQANGTGEIALVTARARANGLSSPIELVDSDFNGDGEPETRLLDHNRSPIAFRISDGWITTQDR